MPKAARRCKHLTARIGITNPCPPVKGDTMDNTDPARSVNVNSLVELVLECGGGWIPPSGSGLFAVKVWAKLLGKNEATVRRWVKKYAIAHTDPGGEMFISAEAMESSLPKINKPGPQKRK